MKKGSTYRMALLAVLSCVTLAMTACGPKNQTEGSAVANPDTQSQSASSDAVDDAEVTPKSEENPPDIFQEPLPEMMEIDPANVKVQFDGKVFAAPFTIEDLMSLGYDIRFWPEGAGFYAVDVTNGSTYEIGDAVVVYTVTGLAQGIIEFRDPNSEKYQGIPATVYNLTGEPEAELGKCTVSWFDISDKGKYRYREHPLFDIIFPGGLSPYKTYTFAELQVVLEDVSEGHWVDFRKDGMKYLFSQQDDGYLFSAFVMGIDTD